MGCGAGSGGRSVPKPTLENLKNNANSKPAADKQVSMGSMGTKNDISKAKVEVNTPETTISS